MKKWILRSILALVLLIIIGLVVLYFSLNGIIKGFVERGGKDATNQNTTLDAANLTMTNGTLGLDNLQIENVKGYSTPQLATLKNCTVIVDTGSLFGSEVKVTSITLDGLELNVDQNGMNNNLADILKAVQSKTAAGGGSTAPGKKLTIGVIKLTGTKVNLNLLGRKMSLDLGPIEIKDPSNPDGRPMKIADVIGKVLINVAKQLAANPQVPELKDALKFVDGFKGDFTKMIPGDLNDLSKNIPTSLPSNVQDLGKNLLDKNPFKK